MAFDTYGVIAPHPPVMVEAVGGPRASVTRASIDAMGRAAELMRRFAPETLVVISPHAPIVTDAFAVLGSREMSGDLAQFEAPQVAVTARGDSELAGAIFAEAQGAGLSMIDRVDMDAPLDLDHGVVVPLSFLYTNPAWNLVVLSYGKFDYERHSMLGQAVTRAARRIGRRVAFIASGDLSHKLTPDAPLGYAREGREFDALVAEHVMNDDIGGLAGLDPDLVGHAAECGLRAIVTLSGFLAGKDARTALLSYEGPWGVGYLVGVAAEPAVVEDLPQPAIVAGTVESPSER